MKWKQLKRNYQSNRLLYWLMFPTILYVVIFNYIPMSGLLMAFEKYSITRGLFGSKWIWFDNFTKFFKSLFFVRTMRNTLVLSLLDLLVAFPAPIILALMLNEVRRPRYKKLVQTCSYMPHFISMIVVVGIVNEFTSADGVIASIVRSMGGMPRSYISMPQYFRSIFIVSNVWQTIGFNSIIYLAALSGVNEELYEAAKIDGAGRIRQLIHVTLPGIMSTVIIMLIMRCGQIMNVNFEKVLLMYSPSTYETADVVMTYIYRMGVVEQNFGYSTAVGLFNSLLGFALILGANSFSRKVTEVSIF